MERGKLPCPRPGKHSSRRPCPSRFVWPMCLLGLTAIASALLYLTVYPLLWMSTLPQSAGTKVPVQDGGTYLLMKVTSALTSTYRLVDEALHVGGTAHFVIQAKDADGRNKTFGGDFWFPVLTSGAGAYPTTGGRTAGSVVDHNNGTYSVFFYAGWEGIAYIHMTLAAPSEATKWLRENYWPVEKRVFWDGEFWGAHSIETAVCFLGRNVTSTSDLCTVDHNPKAMGLTAFYCDKPKVARCEDFRKVSVNGRLVNKRTQELLQDDIKLFEGLNVLQPLRRGPTAVLIAKTRNDTPVDTQAPVCKADGKPLLNDGFWLNVEWHHLQCKVQRWGDVKAVRKCLRHKHVFIHGDSNVRSWYCVIAQKMGYPWKHLGTGKDKMIMHHYYADSDVEMSFYFHPRVVTGAKLSLDTTPYEVDILDSIPRGACNRYVIVLCPWGHFTQWTRESYVERTKLLREAVLRFRERCPDTPVVMKGAHPREHENTLKTVYASDYTLWSWGRTLRETFRGTGVFFYDVWQMSLAYGKPDMHMPLEVTTEEVNWFLSYVCTK